MSYGLRVVVTGGAGFIGSHLADALVARGDRVLIIDNLSSGSRANVNQQAEFVSADVCDPATGDLIEDWRPHVIAHLAAQMSVLRSVRTPAHDVEINVLGSVRIMDSACRAGAFMVFASTGGALYGDADVLPTPETYRPWPMAPYGVSKLAVEHYLHSFNATRGLGYVVLRYGNVYGPRQNPHGEAGVVAIFSQNLVDGRPSLIFGDGRQTRDYIHVDDVVSATMRALDARQPGTYNVGTGRQTDVNRVYRLVAAGLGIKGPAEHVAAKAGEQRTSALDSALARRDLGWRPRIGLPEGLGSTAQWFRNQALAANGSAVAG
jgi:UDP-glucose 4-epimerase